MVKQKRNMQKALMRANADITNLTINLSLHSVQCNLSVGLEKNTFLEVGVTQVETKATFRGDATVDIGFTVQNVELLDGRINRNEKTFAPKIRKMKKVVEVYAVNGSQIDKVVSVRLVYLPHANLNTISHFEVKVAPLYVRVTLSLIDEILAFMANSEEEEAELRKKAKKKLAGKNRSILPRREMKKGLKGDTSSPMSPLYSISKIG
eukprot:UN30277